MSSCLLLLQFVFSPGSGHGQRIRGLGFSVFQVRVFAQQNFWKKHLAFFDLRGAGGPLGSFEGLQNRSKKTVLVIFFGDSCIE